MHGLRQAGFPHLCLWGYEGTGFGEELRGMWKPGCGSLLKCPQSKFRNWPLQLLKSVISITGPQFYFEYLRMSGCALLSSGTSLGSPHTAWIMFQLCFIKAWLWGDTKSSQAGW